MKIIGNENLYVKGIADFDFMKNDGSILYHTSKLQTSQIQTSVNLGTINGGEGNLNLINIPDTPDMSINLTASNFSLEAQAYNVGASVYGGGKAPVTDSVTIGANGVGEILGVPVEPHHNPNIVGTIKKIKPANGAARTVNDGVTFEKNSSGKYTFTYEGATQGDIVCVEYYVSRPDIYEYKFGAIQPMIGKGRVRMALFTAANTLSPQNGTRVGEVIITIPRMQWAGEMNMEGSQTANTNTVVNAKALGAEDESDSCSNSGYTLAYTTIVIYNSDWTETTDKLIVLNSPLNIKVGETKKLNVKAIEGEVLNNVSSSNLKFTSKAASTAKVSADGTVEGIQAGNTTITVTPADEYSNPNILSVVADVTVTA